MGAIHNLFFAGLFGLCCFGYGRLAGLWIHPRLLAFSSLTMLLGLGVLAGLGGVLNLLHLAGPLSLMALLGTGAGASFCVAWPKWRRLENRRKSNSGPAGRWLRPGSWSARNCLLLAAWTVAALISLVLSPSTTFNLHDDFHTYLVRPLRMLATGSVAGNPFDQLGLDGLGAGSFFQAFFVADFDIRKIQGFDAVLCSGLCLMLLAEVCVRWRLSRWIGATAMACFLCINPQVVNISPLYAGSAAILGLIISLIVVWRALIESTPGWTAFRCWFPLALLVSLAAALKVTILLAMAGVIMPVWILGWCMTRDKGRWLGRGAACAVVSLILLLPWILNVAPVVLKARQAAAPCLAGATLREHYASMSAGEAGGLWSATTLYYGNRVTDYHVLTALMLLAGGWCFLASRSRLPGVRGRVLIAALLGPASVAVMVLLAHLFGLQTGIRYVCPMLLATGPAVLLVCASVAKNTLPPETCRRAFRPVLCAGLVVVAIFSGTALNRFRRGLEYGTFIAYPIGPVDVEYSRATLSLGEAMRLKNLQGLARPGESVLAWTVAPFRFDLATGHIFSLGVQGFINPLIHFPAGISPVDFKAYLQRMGVQIVIIEKPGGPAWTVDELKALARKPLIIERKLGEFGLYARETFQALAAMCRIRFEDDRFLVIDLTEAAKLREAEPPP